MPTQKQQKSNKPRLEPEALERLYNASLPDEATLLKLVEVGAKLTPARDRRGDDGKYTRVFDKPKTEPGEEPVFEVVDDPVKALANNPEARFKILLEDSNLCMVDIDALHEDRAKEVVAYLDELGVMKFSTKSGGVHYLLRGCKQTTQLRPFDEQKQKAKVCYNLRVKKHRGTKKNYGELLYHQVNVYKYISGQLFSMSELPDLYELLSWEPYIDKDLLKKVKVDRLIEFKINEIAMNSEMSNSTTHAILHNLRYEMHGLLGEDDRAELFRAGKAIVDYYKTICKESNRTHFDNLEERLKEKEYKIEDVPGRDICEDDIDYALKLVLYRHDNNVHFYRLDDTTKDSDGQIRTWNDTLDCWQDQPINIKGYHGRRSFVDQVLRQYNETYACNSKEGRVPQGQTASSTITAIKTKIVHQSLYEDEVGFDKRDKAEYRHIHTLYESSKGGKYRVFVEKDGDIKSVPNTPDLKLFRSMGVVADKEESVLFDKFLDEIFANDPDTRASVCDFIAAAFLGIKLRPYIIFQGEGDNGKSVLMKVLMDAFGHRVDNSKGFGLAGRKEAFRQNDNGESVRALEGRGQLEHQRLMAIPDFNKMPLDIEFFKSMTVGEEVSIGKMRQNNKSTVLHCLCFFGANDTPPLSAVGRSVRKRLFRVPFKECFGKEKGDKQADDDIYIRLSAEDELPKVRRWIVNRAKDLLKRGRELRISDAIKKDTESYLSANTEILKTIMGHWLEATGTSNPSKTLGLGQSKTDSSEPSGVVALLELIKKLYKPDMRTPSMQDALQVLDDMKIHVTKKYQVCAKLTIHGKVAYDAAVGRLPLDQLPPLEEFTGESSSTSDGEVDDEAEVDVVVEEQEAVQASPVEKHKQVVAHAQVASSDPSRYDLGDMPCGLPNVFGDLVEEVGNEQ